MPNLVKVCTKIISNEQYLKKNRIFADKCRLQGIKATLLSYEHEQEDQDDKGSENQ